MSFPIPLYLRYLAASISGILLVLAFAPFSIWWLSFVCIFILYISIHNIKSRQAITLSAIFGLFYFGFGVPWTFNSIHEFGHAPIVLSAILSALLVIVLSIFPALATLLYTKLSDHRQFTYIGALVFSCLWALLEWLRGWIFTGFPWLLIGHAQHQSPIHGVIPVFGTYGASWIVLIFCCMAAVILYGKFIHKIYSCITLLAAVIFALLVNQTQWTHSEDKEISVALIQGNIPQEMKWDQELHPYIMEKYLKMSSEHFDADIIVWPETAIPTYYRLVKETFIKKLRDTSVNHNVDFLIGVFTYDEGTANVFNSVMSLGKELGFYRKQRLVPFGEYIPFRGIATFLSEYIHLPMADISPGSGRPLVNLNGFVAGASICYEAAYGDEIIKALPEANFLINVSNDAWFGDSFAPHQHLEIARSRALETGRYMLRATNTGISAIIAPDGSIINKSVQFHEDVVKAKIWSYTGLTPFARWGNWGIVTIIILLLIIILGYKWRTNTLRTTDSDNII